ncbi:MAG: helix-turn-helix domain-containing protein [Hymenobacter sp.]
MLEARRLLFHPSSVKEIAFDLGFADASYFTRFFKARNRRRAGRVPRRQPGNVPVMPKNVLLARQSGPVALWDETSPHYRSQ